MIGDGCTRARQRRITSGAGWLFALIALVCTIVLVADHLAALRVQADEKIRVEELERQTGTDVEAAVLLHEERQRQTEVTLAREAHNRLLAWVLLAAGSLAIVCGRWRASLQPQTLPTLDALIDERFATGVSTVSAPVARGEKAIDLNLVDDLVLSLGGGRAAAIPILQAIQAHYRYLPDEVLRHLCQISEITPAQLAGTSSFYAQFRTAPVGDRVVRICHGTACHVAGAERIAQELRRHLEIALDQDTDPKRRFTLEAVACLGCCSLAPVMMVEADVVGRLTPVGARQALDALESPI